MLIPRFRRFLMEDGNYMVDNEQIMSLRQNKDCKQSGNLRDNDAGLVMSSSFLTSFTQSSSPWIFGITFHHMIKTLEFGGVTWLFQYVSHQRTKGQSYYWVPILTLWMVNLRILSMPLTRKISSFFLLGEDWYLHRRHFPTVRMSWNSLQNYRSWYLPRSSFPVTSLD